MKNSIAVLLLVLSSVFLFSSCDDDDDAVPAANYKTGELSLEFTNTAGPVNLDISGSSTYMNEAGESFTVTLFKYYVSNVELIKKDGSTYKIPDSYILVNEADPSSTTASFDDIPGGEYTGVRYLLGIDSAQNQAGAGTGVLDPGNGMYWGWNAGYINLKLEGNSASSPTGDFRYHLGGWMSSQGITSRTIQLDFNGEVLIVDGTREAEVHILADILRIFKTPLELSLAADHHIENSGPRAVMLSENCEDLFAFDHLHN